MAIFRAHLYCFQKNYQKICRLYSLLRFDWLTFTENSLTKSRKKVKVLKILSMEEFKIYPPVNNLPGTKTSEAPSEGVAYWILNKKRLCANGTHLSFVHPNSNDNRPPQILCLTSASFHTVPPLFAILSSPVHHYCIRH